MPHIIPKLRDPLWLHEQYVVKGRSAESIAEEVGCTFVSVYRRMRRFGIETRQPTPKHYPELYDAEWLREQYEAKMQSLLEIADLLECSAMAVHKALVRHEIPRRTPGEQRPSVLRKDAKYGRGPNGESRSTHVGGYVLIHIPDHPEANVRGRVLEHRYIAEQKIGRSLNKGEVVHHINGIRDDNRPENIEVFPSNSAHRKHHEEMKRARPKPD